MGVVVTLRFCSVRLYIGGNSSIFEELIWRIVILFTLTFQMI